MKTFTLNGIIGGILIAVLLATAALGMVWTPFDPMKLSFTARLAAPSAAHLLGTDEFGRDELSRLMVGAKASVWIGFLTVSFATICGTLIGLVSGYARGWVDGVIMAINNALLAFPGILLALGLLAVFGANQYGIIFALGIAYTPSMARVVRGAVLSLREREFIEASRVMGNGELFTMFRHVLPNCLAPITVLATSMFGWAILSESALSF
ncbi:MAG: ABC transporter permease, partial [Spirochaetia bacterium]